MGTRFRATWWLVVLLAALVVNYGFFVQTSVGQQSDMLGLVGLSDMTGESAAFAGIRVASVPLLALLAVSIGLVALRRRQWVAIATACSTVVITYVLIGVARATLPRPDLIGATVPGPGWPSTHVGVAASLIVAGRLMGSSARWLRSTTFAAIGAATLVGVASVATFAHRPSDVLAALVLPNLVPLAVRAVRPKNDLSVLPTVSWSAVLIAPGVLALGGLLNEYAPIWIGNTLVIVAIMTSAWACVVGSGRGASQPFSSAISSSVVASCRQDHLQS